VLAHGHSAVNEDGGFVSGQSDVGRMNFELRSASFELGTGREDRHLTFILSPFGASCFAVNARYVPIAMFLREPVFVHKEN